MSQLAHEYMEEMGVRNTQFIIVRHHNTDHPHIHIVYNRIDNDLKLISVNNDYKRNIKACKRLKDKYELTYGKGKAKVNRQKLTGADKVKYQIHDEIAANLPKCRTYEELETRLRQASITIRYKYRSSAEELPENIQGVSFEKNGIAFKGSDIDRKFSHANIEKVMDKNMDEIIKQILEPAIASKKPQMTISIRETSDYPTAVPMPITPKSGLTEKPTVSSVQNNRPRATVEKERVSPPLQVPRNPTIHGVKLTDEQDNAFMNGEHIYLDGMDRQDGKGKFSSYVFSDDEKKLIFYSNENPDNFVKYGKYEMRLRDKLQVKAGLITRAKVKWHGIGVFAHPYLWHTDKDKPGEYQESWNDPRIPESVRQKQREEEQRREQSQKRPPARRATPPSRQTVPPKCTAPSPKKNNGPKRG